MRESIKMKTEDFNFKFRVAGIIINDNKLLTVNTRQDENVYLPGGYVELGETPVEALKRELKEETNLDVLKYELFDSDSVFVSWKWNGEDVITHHIGIFYKINDYKNKIKEEIEIDDVNDDSLGANFYDIKDLTKDQLSLIAILELEKLGYDLK